MVAETAVLFNRGQPGLDREVDLHPDVDVAQEIVYGALVTGGTPAIRLLGTALGLAVETLGEPT